MIKKILKVVSLASFFLFSFYLLKDSNLPFVGPFGNNNSTYSIQAKNYIKIGLERTRLAPVNKIEGEKFQYYLHHPPLLQLLTALSFKMFGQNLWWPGRFFPIVSTLISIILMTVIAKKLLGETEGWFTLFFASTSPFLFSFGKIIQFEPLLLCITLLFIYIIVQDSSRKKTRWLIFLSIIGCLTDWTMILFLLSVYFIYRTSSLSKNTIRICLYVSFVTLILFFIYASLLVSPKEIISAYIGRNLGSELFGQPWAVPKLILLLFLRSIVYFTPLSFVSAIYLLLKRRTDKVSLIFLLFGSSNILLFLNGAYAHPYWLYYLAPFFIFSSAKLIKQICNQKNKLWLGIIFLTANLAFSCFVIKYKDQQTKKALWQNEFIDQILPFLSQNEEVGVSWDFNEELFRYKGDCLITILWSKEEIMQSANQRKWRYFIFSCWANCNSEDAKIGEILTEKYKLILREKENRAFLFDLTQAAQNQPKEIDDKKSMVEEENVSLPLLYYRMVKNFLGVNQI